jgi:tetratricopeptide (TPR) repeat protein
MTEQAGDRRTVEDALVSWAIDLARTLEEAAQGLHEAQANERLTAEFPNLRAAFDVARARTDVAAMCALVLALEDIASFRAFPEIHTWAVEVAEHVAPDDDDGRVLGSAAASAWMRGQLELAEDLATRGARARTGRERATFTLGVVALLRGDLTDACDRLLEAVDLASPGLRAVYAATAALPAIYDRDLTRAAEIVALAQRNLDESSPPSSAAFTRYAEGELLAHHDPQKAIAQYEQAIALSREVGATFVEGVAMVGLVSRWAHLGRLSEALVGYRWLVAYWRRAGNWTQMWTTLRNLAVTLAEADDPRGALFVLTAAERAPGASSVDAHTRAEHDRLITELEDRLGRPEAERVRARAASLPAGTVVDEALAAVEQALQR